MPDGRFSQLTVATRPPARPRELRTASLASISMAVPDRVVGNDVVAAGAGVTEQWIVHRTGVHERRNVSEGETVASLGTEAGRLALEEAGVDASELDLVLLATLPRTRSFRTRRRSWPPSSAPTAPARWTSAPPAPASCPRSRWRPRRSRAGVPSTCSSSAPTC